MIGDWRQLSFTPCGPQLESPFQAQLSPSAFGRLYQTGFPIKILNQTSRFTSDPLLSLCGRLNNEKICAVADSLNKEKENHAKWINSNIWGKKSVIVVANTETAFAQCDTATGS